MIGSFLERRDIPVNSLEKKDKIILGVSVILAIIATLVFATLIHVNKEYGATMPETIKLYTKKNSKTAKANTPNIRTDPMLESMDQLEGQTSLLLFYKINCPFCEAMHPALSRNLDRLKTDKNKAQDNIYYVNVESELGQKLVKKYEVNDAATMTVIYPNGTYTNYDDVTEKIDGTITSHDERIDLLFQMFENNFDQEIITEE